MGALREKQGRTDPAFLCLVNEFSLIVRTKKSPAIAGLIRRKF